MTGPRVLREGSKRGFGEILVSILAAERRVGDFNAQGLANTVWAFATACQSDAPLFAALARAAE